METGTTEIFPVGWKAKDGLEDIFRGDLQGRDPEMLMKMKSQTFSSAGSLSRSGNLQTFT